MTKLVAWNIKHLYEAMQEDLLSCSDSFERGIVRAICGKEIREKAIEWSKTRKLTPVEVSIAVEFGYNP